MLAAFSVALAWLAWGLRPDAFFVGDPGVKLVAARNALAHPARPLEVSLPVIGAEPAPFAAPFFPIHSDHSHAVTSELFPLVTAPFLAAFGLRGLYVLPALGFLVAIGGCAWIGVALDRRRNAALTAAVAGLSTPLLFYGLEFWEHTLAAGVAAVATALLVQSGRSIDIRSFLVGVLYGIATLLRPETALFAVAVGLASRLLPFPPRAITLAIAAAGAALAVSPLIVYSALHFGTLMPAHVSANAGQLQEGWLAGRAVIASTWFLQASDVNFFGAAPAITCAIVPFAWRPAREGRAFLWCVTLVGAGLVLLTAPNDGGGQWGPRYLLFAYVPLTVLVADAVDIKHARRRVAVALVVAVFAVGLWTQRTSYRRLQGTKSTYGRLVDAVAAIAGPGGYVVTDVWWLDQVAAAAKGSPQFLYAANDESAVKAMRRLSDAAVTTATVIRSRPESPRLNAWIEGACFVEEGRQDLDVGSLVAIRLRRSCP